MMNIIVPFCKHEHRSNLPKTSESMSIKTQTRTWNLMTVRHMATSLHQAASLIGAFKTSLIPLNKG